GPGLPDVRPGFEPRELHGLRLGSGEETCVRGVVERSQHAGNVFERRLFLAPLGQRSQRFSFEVEDVEVPLGPQHLTEMIVAVYPNLRRCELERRARSNLLEQAVANGEESLGPVGDVTG